MKKLQLLLSILLLCVGSNAYGEYYNLETFTDENGITYQVFEFSPNAWNQYALIERIDNQSYTLEIPDQVTRPNGGKATIAGFDNFFRCDCPNMVALIIKNSSYDGILSGNFSGMPNLTNIWFYDSGQSSPAAGKSWRLSGSTTFVSPVNVFLSELVKPREIGFNTYYYDLNSLVPEWKNNPYVRTIRCTDRYRDYGWVGYAPYHSTGSNTEATIVYVNDYVDGELYIPSYSNGWKIDRFGYPDVNTELRCSGVTSIQFGGDITIEPSVDFTQCSALKKLIFQGDAILYKMVFPNSVKIEQIDFHGDIDLGTSLQHQTSLKKVYFHGDLPDDPGYYYPDSENNITFYVNMDIYEIAEWKQNHQKWSNLNMQPIDPSSNYRKVTIINQGEGTFEVRKVRDGIETLALITPNTTRTIEMDRGAFLWTENFSIPETSMYRLSAFVFNDTYSWHENMHPMHEIIEKTNTLKAVYHRLLYPDGTQFNIHLSKVGDGWMGFRVEDENEWATQTLVGMEHDGEERNYVATYHNGTFMSVGFSVSYKKPKDGIVETVTVLANGIPQEPFDTHDDYAPNEVVVDYSVEINGDMDIQIIHQDNARNLSVVNGPGGTIALYRENESEPAATIGDGASLEKIMPKGTGNYAIITPNEGKQAAALFVNKPLSGSARLQLDPSQYKEGDIYRVPLTGFEEGDDTYRLSVLYADKPCYAFDISVIGDGSLKCTPFKTEDGQSQAIREVTVSEAEGRYKSVKAYYDEIGETGYVEFIISSPTVGQNVKVLCNGEDVTNKFTALSNAPQYMRAIIDSSPNENNLGILASSSILAIYESSHSSDDITTWAILQNDGITGSQAVVTRDGEDETTTFSNIRDILKFDKEGVEKVTLKVPVGHEEQVVKYRVRLLTVSNNATDLRNMRLYLRQECGMSSTSIDLLLRLIPAYLRVDFDTQSEAQTIVDGLAAFNATSEVVPYNTTQAVADNCVIKVLLNGEDVTSQMDTSDVLYATYEVPVAELTDAVWEITIEEDGNQTDVNYMFIGNYNYVTAYADYNEGYEYEGSQFHAENVEGYCMGKVVENGSCINEEMGIDFQMQNPNDTFRAFRNGVDVTTQFSKSVNNIWTFTSNDPTMHEPAQWIIVADNDLSRYDANRDGSITIADVTKLVNKILGKE
jgi:hypothetical protein